MSDQVTIDADRPLNFTEPEEVTMLRDSLRRFVEQQMPRAEARRWDREDPKRV